MWRGKFWISESFATTQSFPVLSFFVCFVFFFVFSNFRLGHEIKSEPADGWRYLVILSEWGFSFLIYIISSVLLFFRYSIIVWHLTRTTMGPGVIIWRVLLYDSKIKTHNNNKTDIQINVNIRPTNKVPNRNLRKPN